MAGWAGLVSFDRLRMVCMEKIKHNFQLGDDVQLKSGGPKMSVDALQSDLIQDGKIVCQWFADDKKLESGSFHPSTLILAPTK